MPERDTRAALFVDGGNTFGSAQKMGWRIDSQKLLDLCRTIAERDGYRMEQSYHFSAYDPAQDKQMKFLDALGYMGYTVISKPIKTASDPSGNRFGSKGNLDIEFALKVVEKEDFFSLAIIVSGDSDFEPVVNHLHATKHLVYILSAKDTLSREMRNAGDKVFILDQYRKELEYLGRNTINGEALS